MSETSLISSNSVIMAVLVVTCFHQTQAQDVNYDDSGDPWETPMQELQRIADTCNRTIPGFYKVADTAEVNWQLCIDSLTPNFTILEARNDASIETINSTIIHDIDKQLHMAICLNTTAYKSCWLGVTEALNLCEPGTGDASEKLYFALYDDVCREGGRITVENRRLAASKGRLCERDYNTEQCKLNKKFRDGNDICLRFQSNTACDLSSINPQCSNTVDKRLHAEIFQRVEKVLQCSSSVNSSSNSNSMLSIFAIMCIFFTKVYSLLLFS